jgi:aryl-alcohol dehydrogenase-like predicted oxidoreductase
MGMTGGSMQYKKLGRTDIEIGRIALGCGTFGGIGSPAALIGRGLDESAAFATLDEALALGITWFDTAFSYGGGASDRMIGRWLSQQDREARRRIRIGTKVGTVVSAEGMRMDLSPRTIAEHLDRSLERLGLERVDLCLAHGPDTETRIEATLEGFAAVVEAGKVSYIGACNVTADQLCDALAASDRLGLPRFECVQNAYSLLSRADESELFAVCREHKLGLTPYSPMAGGVLTGKYRRDQPAPRDSRLGFRPEDAMPSPATFDSIELLRQHAAVLGVGAGALALAWVMSHPLVTAPIAGPSRSGEHLQLLREALTLELDEHSRGLIGSWFEGH